MNFTDANTNATTYTYNAFGDVTGELVSEPGKTTDYNYDTYGRMMSMTVADNPVFILFVGR